MNMDSAPSKRIGVVSGGWSHEANYSAAPSVVAGLKRLGFDVSSIDYRSPSFLNEVSAVDVIFPQTLGAFGEDGVLQGLLDHIDVKYVGSGVAPSALCANKYLCSAFVRASAVRHGGREIAGMWSPDNALVTTEISEKRYDELAKRLSTPFVMKPLVCGASFGVEIIENCQSFLEYGAYALKEFKYLLAEELVVGTEYTVGMIEDSKRTIWLPAIPVRRTSSIYSQRDKLQPDRPFKPAARGAIRTRPIDPIVRHSTTPSLPVAGIEDDDEALGESVSPLPPAITAQIGVMNRTLFREIGARGFWRVDLILDEEGCCYVIDINTIPGLIPRLSAFPKMCRTIGIEYDQMLLMLLDSANRPQPMKMPKLPEVPPAPEELEEFLV